jgi:hypothetical protein
MKKRGQFLKLIHTQPINIDIEKFLGRKAILKKGQQRSQGKKKLIHAPTKQKSQFNEKEQREGFIHISHI